LIEGWVNPTASLDAVASKKISCLIGIQTLAVQPIAIPTDLSWHLDSSEFQLKILGSWHTTAFFSQQLSHFTNRSICYYTVVLKFGCIENLPESTHKQVFFNGCMGQFVYEAD
jgi:hypothetical protein